MTTITEYAVRYTEQAGEPPIRESAGTDPTDRDRAESLLAEVQAFQTKNGLPGDAEIVTRTITTTEWEPESPGFKVGDRVIYTSPRTGTPEAGWEFAGPDRSLPSTIRDGLVKLTWVGSDRNMVAHSVDPAHLVLDTAHASEGVA